MGFELVKHLLKLTGAAAALSLLSACGGGGAAGGVAVIPPPPPPPPPPPAAVYPSFATPTSNQQVPLSGVVLSRTDVSTSTGQTQGATSVAAKPFSDGSLSISYDAATSSYTVHDGSRSQTFRPADIRPDFGINGPAFQNYYIENAGPTQQDYLSLYRPGGGGGDVALTYTTLSEWVRISYTDSNDGRTRTTTSQDVMGVGGFETLASDMPRTGTASYAGPLRGYHVNGTALLNVTGQAQLSANFAAGTVQADLFLNRAGFSTLLVGGAGSIASSRFGGTLSGGGYSGPFDGAFFGPAAAEMGLSFSLINAGGERIVGVGAGRK